MFSDVDDEEEVGNEGVLLLLDGERGVRQASAVTSVASFSMSGASVSSAGATSVGQAASVAVVVV